MKWFQHLTDAHTDPEIKELLRKYGLKGYAICWLCRELVGKNGKSFMLRAEKGWKNDLLDLVKLKNGDPDLTEKELDQIMSYQADKNLISRNALKEGHLHIPKMGKYADEYTDKLRRKSRHATDNVSVDKITLDKIRLHYITLKGWQENQLLPEDYARIHSAIKKLLIKTKGEITPALKAIDWVSKQSYCDWTMETVIKKYQDSLLPPKSKLTAAQQHNLEQIKEFAEEHNVNL